MIEFKGWEPRWLRATLEKLDWLDQLKVEAEKRKNLADWTSFLPEAEAHVKDYNWFANRFNDNKYWWMRSLPPVEIKQHAID